MSELTLEEKIRAHTLGILECRWKNPDGEMHAWVEHNQLPYEDKDAEWRITSGKEHLMLTKLDQEHLMLTKLDQDKDRWDLLMDFAPMSWELNQEASDMLIKRMLDPKPLELPYLETWVNIHHVVKVATYRAKKYTDGGWLSVPNGIRRYRAAAIRHRIAMETEENDPESGLPHAWHVEWNLWAVYTLEQKQS